jgi:mono/diheme cytochrome c family protein
MKHWRVCNVTKLHAVRVLVIAGSVIGLAGNLAAQGEIKKVPIGPTEAANGAEMYYTYCASCHGMDGKGNGPAAVMLTTPLADLTKLAQNNGGEFPSLAVLTTLGRVQGAGGHGNSEMPVWGELFRTFKDGEPIAQMRLYNLTRYLENIQDPPARKPEPVKKYEPLRRITDIRVSSGSAMYSGLCASCHGSQGLGDGPVAGSLKTRPADLTILSKNNRGEFPGARIENLLDRNSGASPAHGNTEMPVWGSAFRAMGENPSFVKLRIANIVSYLRSLQR